MTDRYTYGLYGELEQHEGLTQQPFAYNGRDGVMTDANGLYYMRARYYDPKLKRFLNRDVIRGAIQDGQTFNRYAYVNGNPVSYIDPLGLMKCETGGGGAGNPDHPIRTYREANLNKLEAKYTADPRLTVEMPYVGKGKSGTNSEGWLRDKDYYWKEVLEKYPDSLSKSNKQKNELGFSSIDDKQFREHFPQYDIKGTYSDPLIHHHIGGGGQAVAVPSKLHPGSGGIHNVEKEAGVWGSDSKYAEMLERLLNK